MERIKMNEKITKRYEKMFKKKLLEYDMNNRGYDSITDIGGYGQNQEPFGKNVYDQRKRMEKTLSVNLNGDNNIDTIFTKSDIECEKSIYDKISEWIYDKVLLNVSSIHEGFEKVYFFIINNCQEIYKIFGKSLNDEEKKLITIKTLEKLDEKLKVEKINDIISSGNYNLMDFSIDTGIRLDEAYQKIMERAPKSAKAERFIKKSKEYFKKKYGKRWKNVLYATAWKLFKEK